MGWEPCHEVTFDLRDSRPKAGEDFIQRALLLRRVSIACIKSRSHDDHERRILEESPYFRRICDEPLEAVRG